MWCFGHSLARRVLARNMVLEGTFVSNSHRGHLSSGYTTFSHVSTMADEEPGEKHAFCFLRRHSVQEICGRRRCRRGAVVSGVCIFGFVNRDPRMQRCGLKDDVSTKFGVWGLQQIWRSPPSQDAGNRDPG